MSIFRNRDDVQAMAGVLLVGLDMLIAAFQKGDQTQKTDATLILKKTAEAYFAQADDRLTSAIEENRDLADVSE